MRIMGRKEPIIVMVVCNQNLPLNQSLALQACGRLMSDDMGPESHGQSAKGNKKKKFSSILLFSPQIYWEPVHFCLCVNPMETSMYNDYSHKLSYHAIHKHLSRKSFDVKGKKKIAS